MKKSAKNGVKKLQLKSKTICRFEKAVIVNQRAIKGGEEEALSLVKNCTISTVGKP
jgi:hypothetical protein